MKLSSKIVSSALSICLAASFIGCGGSGDGTSTATGVKVGYFVDSPVEGLTYNCGGRTGTTGSDGGFRYNDGETCTFSVGGITVGSVAVPTDGTVTPQDIAGVSRSDTSNGTVAKIAQFLQSLSDESGSIKISPATASKLANTSGSVASIDVSTVASTAGKTVVDMGVAQSRLSSYMNTIAASNPSFFTSGAANTPTTTTTTSSSSSGGSSTPVTYTVPVISSFPATITPTAQVASFTASSDVSATGYWVVLPAAGAAPSAAQIIAGKDASNGAVTLSGSATMSGGTAKTFNITGLAYGTDYKVYFAAKNAGDATKVTSVSTATMTTAAASTVTPSLSSTGVSGTSYNAATFIMASDVGATGYWIAVAKDTVMTGLTAAEVIAHTKSGVTIVSNGSVSMTGGGVTTVTASGLSVNTQYDIYFAAENSENTANATLFASKFTVNTTVAPTISATSVSNTTPLTASPTLSFNLNFASDYYYVIVSSGATAPSAAQIVAGQDSTSTAVDTEKKGSATNQSGAMTPTLGVRGYEAFDLYLVAKNNGDTSKVSGVTKISYTTPVATSAIGTGTAGETDGAASAATFTYPTATLVKSNGDVLVIDNADNTTPNVNNGLRVVNGGTGAVTTLSAMGAGLNGVKSMVYTGTTGGVCIGTYGTGSVPLTCKVSVTDFSGGADVTTLHGNDGSITFTPTGNVEYMASSGDNILFVANGTTLYKFDLSTDGSETVATTDISGATGLNSEAIRGIAADATYVYISTSGNRILKYTRANLSAAPTVLAVGDDVAGMAIDGSGNLFYLAVDHGRTTIAFVPAGGDGSVNGSVVRAILPSDASRPTADGTPSAGGKYLAVDSTGKKFYVTDTLGHQVIKVVIP